MAFIPPPTPRQCHLLAGFLGRLTIGGLPGGGWLTPVFANLPPSEVMAAIHTPDPAAVRRVALALPPADHTRLAILLHYRLESHACHVRPDALRGMLWAAWLMDRANLLNRAGGLPAVAGMFRFAGVPMDDAGNVWRPLPDLEGCP